MAKNPNNNNGGSERNANNWKVKFKNVRNVAKNIAGMTIGELAPGITDTVNSANDSIREAHQFISKTKNQVAGQEGSLSRSSVGRKAMNIVREAFDDLKNGSYGLDKISDESFDMEDDFDADIRDYESGINGSTDPETTAMFESKKNTAMLGKVIAHGNATTVSSFGHMTKTMAGVTLKASQAQTAQLTNVMLTSLNTQTAYMGMIGGKLESINSNLVNIIEFNNNATAEYYQKTAEYQSSVLEMMHSFGETLSKMQDIAENKSSEDEFDFSSSFNLSTYKNLVKKNFDNSMLSMVTSIGGMAGMMGNPLTMAMPMLLGMVAPGFIKKPIERFDKSFTRGMENLLYRIGDLEYSSSFFSPLGEIFGKKRKSIAKLNMGDYKKDAMSWNGTAQKYLTEVIPSYLAKIEAGVNGTSERYYHEGKGRFLSNREMDKEFDKQLRSTYEFGMGDFSRELKSALKKNNITEDEAELIMNRLNTSLTNTIKSSSGKQGKNREISMGLLKSQLSGKVDDNTIHDLMMQMNSDLTQTMSNMDRFIKNMDTGYRHLFTQTGQKKDPTLDKRSFGNINSKRKYGVTGKLLDDMDEDERILEEFKSEYKEKSLKGRAFEVWMRKKFGKNWKDNAEYKEKYADRHPDEKKDSKVTFIDKGSNWIFDVLSGVTPAENIDLSEIDEQIAKFAKQAKKNKNARKGKAKFKKGNVKGNANATEYQEDDLIDEISSTVSTIVASNVNSSGGFGWKEDDHAALTKIIPDKLDKIEQAISKLDSTMASLFSFSTGNTSSSNATGQSSNTHPTGGSKKFGLLTFSDSMNKSSNELERIANQTQNRLNGNSKGNESGPTSNNLSSADVIANRLQENEESLSDLVRATNDNFMAPMVGGIFGKDGMIRKFFSKENLKSIGDRLFNEKDGIFKNVGAWFKDQMDYVKYVFTGKGYTNRKGDKFEENKNSVFDHLTNGYDWVYTKTMQHIFGDDYKENENFQKYFQRFDFKSNREEKRQKRLQTLDVAEEVSDDSTDIDNRIQELKDKINSGTLGSAAQKRANKELNELYHKRKKAKKNASPQQDIQSAGVSTAQKLSQAGDDLVHKVVGDVNDTDIKNDKKKFASKYKDTLKKYLPAGIAAGLAGGALGLLSSVQGGGAIAPLFFSGGPIAGAVLGVSAMILSKSEKFKNILFGEKDDDGKRSGGFISQKTQDFFKKNAPLLVGGAALGALKGVFKTAIGGSVVGGPGGFLLNTLLPGGVIGGAVMGLGISLLKSNERFSSILFGNKDGDGNSDKKKSGSISKKLSEVFSKSGHYIKGGLKGAAIGVGSGIALGSMGVLGGALSVGGPIGMGVLGLGLGIASQADRAKELLFGTEEFDEDGKSKGRRKNGLFPRLRNYLVVDVFEPLKDRLQEKVEDFGFWLKKNITYPFRLAFGPIIDSFREIRKDISDTIKNVFENVALTIGKTVKGVVDVAFKPVTNAFKKVGKTMIDVTFAGAKMALSPVSLGLNLVKFGSRNLRKKALGQRTKTLRQHVGDIYRGVRDVTLDQWENDDREYAPGLFGKVDRFLTHGRDIFRNTREGIDAAKSAYNTGIKQQGFNSLGWMNVDLEQRRDKRLKKTLKGDRKTWKGIDAARREIAKENSHSEIFASADQLEQYKRRLKKSGFEYTNLIQNTSDLNDLIYNKEDFLERIKNGDRNKIKDSNATMDFYAKTKDYQQYVMDKFGVITKAFLKYSTQDAIARRKNLSLKNITEIDNNLREAGLSWKDIGIEPGSLTDIATLSDEDWYTYMNERLKPENRNVALYDDLIRDILERQAQEAERAGEQNQEVIDRLDALNEIEEANARMNASEQMNDTGASAEDISQAAGHNFGNRFDDPITRHKKEQEEAERRAREGLESEKIRNGHKSSQDEDEEDKDKEEEGKEKKEKSNKSVFGGIWEGFTGLLGGIGGLFGNKSFWKYAGIATVAGATFGPWAKDVFGKVLKFLDPVTKFLGEKLKDAGTWLGAHLPEITTKLVDNLVDNMGFVVSNVWKLAGSATTEIGKKMVNGLFHLVGLDGPFPDSESSVNERKTFETEKEAEDFANLTGKNVDGKTSYGTSEYKDDDGNIHRTSKGNAFGVAGKNAALYATSSLHRKSKWIATWPGKATVGIVKLSSGKLGKAASGIFKGAKWVAKKTVGKSTTISTILKKILEGFKKVKNIAAKTLKLKNTSMWDTICKKSIKMIEKAFVDNPEMQKKLAAKITKATGFMASKAIVPLAIGLGIYDAVTGSTDKATAYLFGIDEDAVDGKMKTISALFKVLSGLPVFGWIDVIAEVYYQISGNDLRQEWARWLYNFLPGGDKEALQDEIDRYELEFTKYRDENNLNIDLAHYREVRKKNKQKIDFSQWDASDEELAEYKRNKYKTNKYKTNNTSSKSDAALNSNNDVFYSGVGGYDTTVEDPSNVGFGIGDSRRKQRRAVGYGNSMQGDPRWANFPLGKFPSGRTSTMATGGCGPTALSMVASSTDPLSVAKDAKTQGYIKDGGATSDLFTKGAKKYGLDASNVSRSNLENTLKSGKPTILSGKSTGNGPYTEAGHVIVANGMDSSGNTIVNDPMRGTRKVKASELGKGLTQGWSYSSNAGYGSGDVAGYGGVNMMSMSNAMTQSVRGEDTRNSKGYYFIYNGKKYKQVIDYEGNETWQEMGFLDLFNRYTKTDPPKGFDPKTALAKGAIARNSLNIDGKTYNMKYLTSQAASDTKNGKYIRAVYNSAETPDKIKSAVNNSYIKAKTGKDPSEKAPKVISMQDYGKMLNQGIKDMFPDSDHSLTEQMLANKYGFSTTTDNPALAKGGGPNALLEAVNQGTLNTEEKIRSKINSGYQQTDGEYNFNLEDFYYGLKVADIKAMAEYQPSLLSDLKIPKFKAVYNYYVKSGLYKLSRNLRENELADIFGRSDFVKLLGGNGQDGDYEYKYGFPFYQTTDPRWADIKWRGSNVKNRGGDLASLAMVATAFGPNILDPEYVYSKWVSKNSDWYSSTSGLKFDKVFAEDGYPAQKAGKVNHKSVIAKKLTNYNTILSYLKANKPVVMTGYRYKGGPFGGYYDRANAPINGPDDYATVVARSANDAHMAVLNPFTTRTQNGIFDIHHLNKEVAGKTRVVKEAYGITGPSGGGITGKVDLSEKDRSTSDYIDLSAEKGLDKIIALFKNIAMIGTHLFDAILGSEDYVSIFEEVEKDGGIDEEGDGTESSSTTKTTKTTTTTTTTDGSSLLNGMSNTLNTNGKVNCYLYRNAYYLKLGTNFYKRITDEDYAKLSEEGSIILNGSVPHDLMTGSARIYGVSLSGTNAPSVISNSKTDRASSNAPTYKAPVTGADKFRNAHNNLIEVKNQSTTNIPSSNNVITWSGIKDWWKRVTQRKSTSSNLNFNTVNLGGASRDLVFGEGDVVGYGRTSNGLKRKLTNSSSSSTTKTAAQEAQSQQIQIILKKKARGGKLTPYEEQVLATYQARIQSNAPKQPSYVITSDGLARKSSNASSSGSALDTVTSAVESLPTVQFQIPEIQQQNGAAHITPSNNRAIDYLVMHYTAGTSSAVGTASGTASYFAKPEAGGSADFIVDDGSIVQYNGDPKNGFCHAVGGDPYPSVTTSLGAKLHGTARNDNSISIEMCSNMKPGGDSNDAMDPGWYITEETENNAAGLAAKLLKDYNIPQDHLIMHHHVTGKVCPAPWTRNESELSGWEAFKQKVATGGAITGTDSSTTSTSGATTTETTETTTTEGERDFSKLPSSVQMGAIMNANIAAAFGDNYEKAKQHYLEAAYDQYFGAPETTTTTTTTTGTTPDTFGSNTIGATSTSGTATLDPSNVQQSVWNYFTSKGYGTYGTAGIMGNMNHESGLIVNRKQGDFSNGYTASAEYTKAADSGSIDFVNDSIGYGLVQFTYHTLKQSLLNRAKSEGKSVGDLGVQLDEIDNYLNGNGLAGKLKAATSVREASNIFLHEYERPADQSAAVEATRAAAGESFFAQFANSTGYGPGPNDDNVIQKLANKNPMRFKHQYVRAVGYGGNWLEICAEVKKQMNAQCAAKGQWYSWYDSVPISVNGVNISIRQDCSGYVGGCLTVYGCANMLNTATPAYYRGNQDLINAGFKDMDWPGQENLLPGDIIVDTNPGAGGHVEVYAGNGQVYSAGSDAAIQNPGTTGISRSSYPIVWRPTDAGGVGNSTDSSTTSGSSTTTTTTETTQQQKTAYMDPFTRMMSGLSDMMLQTSTGKMIAFGPGEDNPEAFFTNTLGGNVSSTYGKRSSQLGNEFHRGMDIEAPSGRKIYSPVSGKVVSTGSDVAGYGNYTVVRDGRGKNHIFAHMKNPSVYGVGDDIDRFDVLGEVGSTGRSTGNHLHYEIRNNGNKYSTIDPAKYSYDEEVSRSLNIHNANRRSSSDISENSGAAVGSGNRDLQSTGIKEKLNAAVTTKNIEDKMDVMIEALQMMVDNTSQPVQPATSSITENNTIVYGEGGGKKRTKKETVERKNTKETKEGEDLAGIHRMIARRG